MGEQSEKLWNARSIQIIVLQITQLIVRLSSVAGGLSLESHKSVQVRLAITQMKD